MQKPLKRKTSQSQSYLCPHNALLYLANISTAEYEKDRTKYICMQTRLGFVLFGVLGDIKLKQFGYPDKTVTEILETVLRKTKTPVICFLPITNDSLTIIIFVICYRCIINTRCNLLL